MPALATRISRPPYSFSVAAITSGQRSSSVTSWVRNIALPPVADDGLDERLAARRVDVGDDDACAFAREREAARFPDPRGAACDERHLALDLSVRLRHVRAPCPCAGPVLGAPVLRPRLSISASPRHRAARDEWHRAKYAGRGLSLPSRPPLAPGPHPVNAFRRTVDPCGEMRMRVFSGLKVLDFTTTIAGPYCARLLADLGADVIKIESPEGDLMRSRPPIRNGASSSFGQLNAGKRSIVLDFKRKEAVAAARRLIGEAEVVVENFRPGVMKRLGLDFASVAEEMPGLVYCSISGYGQTGPSSDKPAYAPVVHATSGYDLAHIAHQGGRTRPDCCGIFVADVVAGTYAFGAISAALAHRALTGEGQHLDVSMMESMLALTLTEVQAAQFEVPPPPKRALYGPTATADGFVNIAVASERTFRELAKAAGREDWVTDPRFAEVSRPPRQLGCLHGRTRSMDEDAVDRGVHGGLRALWCAGRPLSHGARGARRSAARPSSIARRSARRGRHVQGRQSRRSGCRSQRRWRVRTPRRSASTRARFWPRSATTRARSPRSPGAEPALALFSIRTARSRRRSGTCRRCENATPSSSRRRRYRRSRRRFPSGASARASAHCRRISDWP